MLEAKDFRPYFSSELKAKHAYLLFNRSSVRHMKSFYYSFIALGHERIHFYARDDRGGEADLH